MINMVLPVIILAIVGPFVFVLPVESGEKIGFALTVLLNMSVVMTIVSDNIPPISTQTCQLSTIYICLKRYALNLHLALAISVTKTYRHLNKNFPY